MTNKPKIQSTIEPEEEISVTGPVVVNQIAVKESLYDSGRFRVAIFTGVIDALLAVLPVLVAHADPVFVAAVSNAVNILMTLWTIIGVSFIGARTLRNMAVSEE
jgi:hypothetical protein